MAFSEFFVEPGGNDVAAGSTTGASLVTSTNGDWGSVTANRFTPAGGGTPFAAVTVGMWASIYLDGATLVVFVAQVTAVNGGGATLDFSTTAKYGVAPATGSTGRSIKIGGAWATPWAFINTGTTAVYNNTRINIKAGTYNSTATRAFNNVGAQTAFIWWRGYNLTPGNLDTDYTTAKPLFNLTTVTGFINCTGIWNMFSNLNVVGNRTTGSILSVSTSAIFNRCRFENQAVNAASNAAFTQTTSAGVFTDCYFKATTTASRVFQLGITASLRKCTFEGGLVGLELNTSPNFVDHCVFIGNLSHGILYTAAAAVRIFRCSFKGCGGDGVHFNAASGVSGNLITGCLFDGCAGWGINNASGTQMFHTVEDNVYYVGSGLGTITGFGDTPDLRALTESSSPAVSSSDPTISAVTFNSASMPRPFEGKTFTGGFFDAGAIQRKVVPAGGARMVTLA